MKIYQSGMLSGFTSFLLFIHVFLHVQGSILWSHYHSHHHTHLTGHGLTAALESPESGTSQTIISENRPFYLYSPVGAVPSQHDNISQFLQSFPRIHDTFNQRHSQTISNIHSLRHPNPNNALWSFDNKGNLFQVQITAADSIFQQRFLNSLYSIYNNRCNYWTKPDNRYQQFVIPCIILQLPLPNNLRTSMMEHLSTKDSFTLYLEHMGLTSKDSAWPPVDAVHHCVLHSVTSPSVHQAVMVSNILKRNTILIMPRKSHVWKPELVYLPGDIDKLITETLLESVDNNACIQNYLLSYKVQVPSAGGGNTTISSTNKANTDTNGSVADGLKTFTPKSTEVVWNEERKRNNVSDTSCIKSQGNILQANDITIETAKRYDNGVSVEPAATDNRQIQKNTATAYHEIPAETITPYQIQIPVKTTTAYETGTPVESTITYPSEMHRKTNSTMFQKEILTKTTTTYHNILDETTAAYHTEVEDATTAVLNHATAKNTTPYQGKIPVKNKTYQSEIPVEKTTVYHNNVPIITKTTYHRQIPSSDYRNFIVKTLTPHTFDALGDRGYTVQLSQESDNNSGASPQTGNKPNNVSFVSKNVIVLGTWPVKEKEFDEENEHDITSSGSKHLNGNEDTARSNWTMGDLNVSKEEKQTQDNISPELRKVYSFDDFRQALYVLEAVDRGRPQNPEDKHTEAHNSEQQVSSFENYNFLYSKSTGVNETNSHSSSSEINAKNISRTDTIQRTIHLKEDTADNPPKGITQGLRESTKGAEFKPAYQQGIVESAADRLDDETTNTELATVRRLLQTTTDKLNDRKISMEFVTARNLLKTTNDEVDYRTTNTEFVTARNLLKTTNDEVDYRTTNTEFVTARNLLKTTNVEVDYRTTNTEFITARNLLKTTNDEVDYRTTNMEFVTARNLPKTTNVEVDDRITNTEFVTARNLLKTTNDEVDYGTTNTEFVTARNLPKTTNDEVDYRTKNTEFVTARNLPKTTNVEVDYRTTNTEFVTARNLPKTTNVEVDYKTTNTEFVTARNLPKTTNDEVDYRTTNTEFVTARNLPKTANVEVDYNRTNTEFVTARNLPKTTNDEVDYRTKNTEFVTARNLLKTTNDEVDYRTTNTEFVTARNLPKTTNDEVDYRTKNTEFVTARNLPKTTNVEVDDRITNTEFVTARNLLKTTNDEVDYRTTNTEFVTARNLPTTTNDEVDYRTTNTEFVTARNLPKTTNVEVDYRTTNTEFVTTRNLPKTTNDEVDYRTTNAEFVTARNLPKTTNVDVDYRTKNTEFVTARNLLKTTDDEVDDRTTNTEFVTARNLLKTTNDEADDRTTNTEVVTAGKLLQTVVYGMPKGKTEPTTVTAWNTLITTTGISSDIATNAEYVTPRNAFERNTESLKDSTTKTEPITVSDVLRAVTANLTDNTEEILFDIRVTPYEDLSGGLSVCKGTKIQLEATTNRPKDNNSTATTDSLETVDTTESRSESSNYLLHSASQSTPDLTEDSSPVFDNTIATSPGSLPNQPPLVTTSSTTEPMGNTDYDTISEENSDEKRVTHYNASNQIMPGKEESFSNVINASHVNMDKDTDILEQITEPAQALHNSTSTDIFEIMEQMVNSTISPAELLTLQILYELLLSKYDVAHVSEDTETPGGTNTTYRVPQNGVWSEIQRTIKVLGNIPGIMDNNILDKFTDEEINGLREAVEHVWSIVENETEIDINSSLVKTHHEIDDTRKSSTLIQVPEINRNRSTRKITEGLLGKQVEIHKSVGSPLGFLIRNVTYNAKNWLASLVTGNPNVISDHSPKDNRFYQNEGNSVTEN